MTDKTRRKRRIRDPEIRLLTKAIRLLRAKSVSARLNYLIDLVAECQLQNVPLDEALHAINEMLHGTGTLADRMQVWLEKMRRYRRR